MIALIISIICFGLSVYQILNGSDIGGVILMTSSIIFYVLYLINSLLAGNLEVRKAIVGSTICKKEENSYGSTEI